MKTLKPILSTGSWSYVMNDNGHCLRMTFEGYGSCTPTDVIQKMIDGLTKEQFDEKFIPYMDISGRMLSKSFRKYLRTSLISLLEKYGEEVISIVPVKEIAEYQRTKLKEILSNLK